MLRECLRSLKSTYLKLERGCRRLPRFGLSTFFRLAGSSATSAGFPVISRTYISLYPLTLVGGEPLISAHSHRHFIYMAFVELRFRPSQPTWLDHNVLC